MLAQLIRVWEFDLQNMMTAETNATPSPDLMPLKTEELASLLEPSKLPMGAKQRYALVRPLFNFERGRHDSS